MLSIALPLSLEFQHDLAQHAESVLNNEIKALQLRPTLERRNSISTLSSCSSISPPPDPDFPRAVRRESVAYDTSARFDTRLIDLTKARSDCPFIDLTQSHQISIMTKNGIFNLYVSHAQDHIDQHETSRKLSKISRARVELELLTAIDDGDFPIEYKLCWNKAILSSSNFESFWLDKGRRLKLPRHCIERYSPSDTHLEYETPNPSESEGDSSGPGIADHQSTTDSDYVHPAQLPTPRTEDEDYEEAKGGEQYITPEAAAFARRLGGEDSSTAPSTEAAPSSDPRHVHSSKHLQAPGSFPSTSSSLLTSNPLTPIPPRSAIGLDLNGLARESGDDGAWGISKKSSKPKKSRCASTSTRTPRSTPPVDRTMKKPRTGKAKRDFAAIADEVGPCGTVQKKARKGGGGGGKGNGTSVAGRRRLKTEKARGMGKGMV